MHTVSLNECDASDVERVGGKGASLGEMLHAGIPVPPGFVVTTTAFEEFMKTGIISETVAQEILSTYEQLGSPSLVAVRSSATGEDSKNASWAGELETYLNTTKEQLIENIQRCWASINSPRAQAYAKKQSISNLSMAVVIQEMIQSEVSGVTFTVHPVSEDRNLMIIEAGWGLGEAIVSGSITPDSYVVDKRDWRVIESAVNVQEKQFVYSTVSRKNEWVEIAPSQQGRQKFSPSQIIELATLCGKIEQHYQFPCDIEWAYVKMEEARNSEQPTGKFYITQSRPITTLGIRH